MNTVKVRKASELKNLEELRMSKEDFEQTRGALSGISSSLTYCVNDARGSLFKYHNPKLEAFIKALDEAGFIRRDINASYLRIVDFYKNFFSISYGLWHTDDYEYEYLYMIDGAKGILEEYLKKKFPESEAELIMAYYGLDADERKSTRRIARGAGITPYELEKRIKRYVAQIDKNDLPKIFYVTDDRIVDNAKAEAELWEKVTSEKKKELEEGIREIYDSPGYSEYIGEVEALKKEFKKLCELRDKSVISSHYFVNHHDYCFNWDCLKKQTQQMSKILRRTEELKKTEFYKREKELEHLEGEYCHAKNGGYHDYVRILNRIQDWPVSLEGLKEYLASRTFPSYDLDKEVERLERFGIKDRLILLDGLIFYS